MTAKVLKMSMEIEGPAMLPFSEIPQRMYTREVNKQRNKKVTQEPVLTNQKTAKRKSPNSE